MNTPKMGRPPLNAEAMAKMGRPPLNAEAMAKMGRPPLNAEAMAKVRGVRFTVEEDAEIVRAAAADDEPVARWIRHAALRAARAARSDAEEAPGGGRPRPSPR